TRQAGRGEEERQSRADEAPPPAAPRPPQDSPRGRHQGRGGPRSSRRMALEIQGLRLETPLVQGGGEGPAAALEAGRGVLAREVDPGEEALRRREERRAERGGGARPGEAVGCGAPGGGSHERRRRGRRRAAYAAAGRIHAGPRPRPK